MIKVLLKYLLPEPFDYEGRRRNEEILGRGLSIVQQYIVLIESCLLLKFEKQRDVVLITPL
jgi:hypothetical protein